MQRRRLRTTAAGVVLGTILLGSTGCASSPSYQMSFEHPEAEAQKTPRPAGVVLMVLSAAPVQTLADGSTRETGYFLNEFYEPYRSLVEAGYEVAIATPEGRPPALDPESLNEKYPRSSAVSPTIPPPSKDDA